MLRSNPSVLAQLSLKMICGGTDSKTQSALRYLLKRRKLMRYHYISDSHVHSDCSFDGTDPVMMICERAAALGFTPSPSPITVNAIFIIKRALTVLWYNPFLRPERPGRCFTAGFRYTPASSWASHHRSESDPGGLVRRRLRFCAGFGT